MARYQYKCKECNINVTVEKPMKDYARIEYCSLCDNELIRVYEATPNQWKCGGAYVTDSK